MGKQVVDSGWVEYRRWNMQNSNSTQKNESRNEWRNKIGGTDWKNAYEIDWSIMKWMKANKKLSNQGRGTNESTQGVHWSVYGMKKCDRDLGIGNIMWIIGCDILKLREMN